MTEREKLFNLATHSNNPAWRWFPNNAEMLRFVDYLLANGVTIQEWIPVSERLPERFEEVLCWYAYRNGKGEMVQAYDIGFYFRDDTWGGEVSNGYDTKVLAWMPLPEPPKEET